MEQFLESFPMGYMHFTPDGSATLNTAYERVTGYSKEDWKDPLAVAKALHGEDR